MDSENALGVDRLGGVDRAGRRGAPRLRRRYDNAGGKEFREATHRKASRAGYGRGIVSREVANLTRTA